MHSVVATPSRITGQHFRTYPPPETHASASASPTGSAAILTSALKSIEYAEATMERTKTQIDKSTAAKDSRSKAVSKASSIVSALLDPALQVANLLDGVGALFPPCKVASNTLNVR